MENLQSFLENLWSVSAAATCVKVISYKLRKKTSDSTSAYLTLSFSNCAVKYCLSNRGHRKVL